MRLYHELLDVDVRGYFRDLPQVFLLRCLDTNYRFFFPFDLEGDSPLYERLSRRPEFYLDWKWEYGIADRYIRSGDRVLEIGAGRGSFIKHLQRRGVGCVGLEINRETIANAEGNNLNIIGDTIQEHADARRGQYDVVCAFQVLEHIAAVGSFIGAAVGALRTGGLLILGVPNNASFIQYDKRLPTNLPPHHMGWWDERSLRSLELFFSVRVLRFYFQPIVENWEHDWFYRTQLARAVRLAGGEGTLRSKAVYKAASLLRLGRVSRFFSAWARNHTVVAIYQRARQ